MYALWFNLICAPRKKRKRFHPKRNAFSHFHFLPSFLSRQNCVVDGCLFYFIYMLLDIDPGCRPERLRHLPTGRRLPVAVLAEAEAELRGLLAVVVAPAVVLGLVGFLVAADEGTLGFGLPTVAVALVAAVVGDRFVAESRQTTKREEEKKATNHHYGAAKTILRLGKSERYLLRLRTAWWCAVPHSPWSGQRRRASWPLA